MQVKVINECWYNEKHYIPDVEGEEVIDYPCDNEKYLPSWAEPLTGKKEAKIPVAKAPEKEPAGDEPKKKVKDLPVAEKNLLLERAEAAGIKGNQILSWNVETLEAKIAEKEPAKPAGDEDNNNDNNEDTNNENEGQDE